MPRRRAVSLLALSSDQVPYPTKTRPMAPAASPSGARWSNFKAERPRPASCDLATACASKCATSRVKLSSERSTRMSSPTAKPELVHYTYFRSSAAFRTRIALNLKGLKPEQVFVHLRKNEQTAPAYLKLNPQGLVPTLIHERHT